jgi:hypothetical protein
MQELHRAPPPPPASNGYGPYGILAVCCSYLWPTVRMELGQEAKVRRPIMAGDSSWRGGGLNFETPVVRRGPFKKDRKSGGLTLPLLAPPEVTAIYADQ